MKSAIELTNLRIESINWLVIEFILYCMILCMLAGQDDHCLSFSDVQVLISEGHWPLTGRYFERNVWRTWVMSRLHPSMFKVSKIMLVVIITKYMKHMSEVKIMPALAKTCSK